MNDTLLLIGHTFKVHNQRLVTTCNTGPRILLTLFKKSRGTAALVPLSFLSSPWFCSLDFIFVPTHNNLPREVRSELRGGHMFGPLRPIHREVKQLSLAMHKCAAKTVALLHLEWCEYFITAPLRSNGQQKCQAYQSTQVFIVALYPCLLRSWKGLFGPIEGNYEVVVYKLSGTAHPLHRSGVSLLSRERFLYIYSTNIFHYLIFSWPCIVDINNIGNQLDATITAY